MTPNSIDSICIGFIGAGRLGGSLALAMQRAGMNVRAIGSARAESARRVAALDRPVGRGHENEIAARRDFLRRHRRATGDELHRLPRDSADLVHAMVQAKQIAYHDRDRHLADPLYCDVPIERLISKAYADQRRTLLDPSHALPWHRVYGSLNGDTVFIAAVDGEGNAAALINSLTACSVRAWWLVAPACCCKTAPRTSRSTPRTPAAWRRARRRCTR